MRDTRAGCRAGGDRYRVMSSRLVSHELATPERALIEHNWRTKLNGRRDPFGTDRLFDGLGLGRARRVAVGYFVGLLDQVLALLEHDADVVADSAVNLDNGRRLG